MKKLFFILFFLIFNLLTFGKEFEGNYEEGYIEININKKIKYDFFPIYMDYEAEEPYIGVLNVFTLIMANNMKIDREKKQIYGKIGEEEYIFDYSKTQYITGSSDIFIRGTDLSSVFKLEEYNWSTETYIATLKTSFKTPYEEFIEQQERILGLQKEKKEEILDRDLLLGERKLFSWGVIKPRYTNSNVEKSKGTLSMRYETQMLYGDFSTTGFIYPDSYLGYTALKYNEVIDGKSIIVGDSNMQTYDFFGSRRLTGIALQNWNGMGDIEVGETSITGFAPYNSTVELYRNGMLYRFTRVKEDGLYTFENIRIQGYSDIYTVKIYNYDGSIEIKQISMMSGSKILKKGNLDYTGVIGKYREITEEDETIDIESKVVEGQGKISYGLTNSLTLGFEYNNHNKSEKNGNIIYNIPVETTGIDLYYTTGAVKFPTYFEFSEIYDIKNYLELDNPYTHIGKIRQRIYDNVLSLEAYRYGDFIGVLEKVENEYQVDWRGNLTQYWGYNITYNNYDYYGYVEEYGEIGLVRNATESSHDMGVEFPLSKDYGVTQVYYTYSNNNINLLNSNFNFVIELKSAPEYYEVDSDARLTFKSSGNKMINGGVYGAYNMQKEYAVGVEVEYKVTDWFEIIGMLGRRNKNTAHAIGVDIEKTIIIEKAFIKNSNPSTNKSWLEGQLFLDDNGNGVKDPEEKPLEGVEVKVGRRTSITDKDGNYFIDNISAYDKNDFEISSRTMDPMLEPGNEKKFIKLYPASGEKMDVPIQPISVIMGTINVFNEPVNGIEHFRIISQLYIKLKNLDGDLIMEKRVEPEGFYMLDKVLPGEYLLEINYIGEEDIKFEKKSKEIKIILDKYGSYYEDYNFEVIEVNGKTINDMKK